MEAEFGKTGLTVPHERGELIVTNFPYSGQRLQIEMKMNRDGFKVPTSAETAFLVYGVFQNPRGENEAVIIQSLQRALFWEREGNLYLAKNPGAEVHYGVIIANPEIIGGRIIMDKSSLIQRLKDGDKSVRFEPFGKDFQKRYLTARYGGEGSDKINELAEKYRKELKILILDSVDEDVQRMSSLNCFSGNLDLIVCGYFGGNYEGRAFGITNFEKAA